MLQELTIEGVDPRTLGWVAGLLLLVAGRRLYWLFSGLVGFFLGLYLAGRFVPGGPGWLAPLVALLLGAFGALVAIFFQKVAIGVAGFLAGAYTFAWLASEAGWDFGPWTWVAAIAAGFVGVLLLRGLFDLALVLLTSLLGAALVVQAAGWQPPRAGPLFLGLAAAGAIVQLIITRRRSRKSD